MQKALALFIIRNTSPAFPSHVRSDLIRWETLTEWVKRNGRPIILCFRIIFKYDGPLRLYLMLTIWIWVVCIIQKQLEIDARLSYWDDVILQKKTEKISTDQLLFAVCLTEWLPALYLRHHISVCIDLLAKVTFFKNDQQSINPVSLRYAFKR